MTDFLSTYLTVRNYVAYFTIGLLIYGLYVLTRNVPPGRERQSLIACLLVWWAALLWLLWVGFWRGLNSLAIGLEHVFNPDHGPLATTIGTLHMWRRHWTARLAGRDPYQLRLAEWERERKREEAA